MGFMPAKEVALEQPLDLAVPGRKDDPMIIALFMLIVPMAATLVAIFDGQTRSAIAMRTPRIEQALDLIYEWRTWRAIRAGDPQRLSKIHQNQVYTLVWLYRLDTGSKLYEVLGRVGPERAKRDIKDEHNYSRLIVQGCSPHAEGGQIDLAEAV
jgi:hypothetical protein